MVGLSGTVELNNNGGEEFISISENGVFAFGDLLADGSSYNVTIEKQPFPQTCSVANGNGKIMGQNVTNIWVTCSTEAYYIGRTLSGLTEGETLELQNNGGDNLELKANGTFTFNTKVLTPFTYKVTVHDQPNMQYCTIAGGSGTASDNVMNVVVACTDNKQILGTNGTNIKTGCLRQTQPIPGA